MIAMIANAIIIGAKYLAPAGRMGRLNRRKPYVPIFSRTAARMTEPAVGASVCASGNHVWNGNIGTLIANPRKNARKIHHCMLNGTDSLWNAVTSNVYTPVREWL